MQDVKPSFRAVRCRGIPPSHAWRRHGNDDLMTVLLLAFLGGVLTILSPCILPVIPLVFSRTGRSFGREILPMLGGLAFAFTVAALGAVMSLAVVASLANRLLARIRRAGAADVIVRRTLGAATPSRPRMATLRGTEWINSPELTPAALRGKVVLVDFWTFACYNCLNTLPHVKELYAKYKDRGFVVIGVHTPELAHERLPENVRREVKRLGITYPVVIDNDNRIWNAFRNQYWPAAWFADTTGKLRFYHFGEGRYEEQDKVVAKLLAERDASTPRGDH